MLCICECLAYFNMFASSAPNLGLWFLVYLNVCVIRSSWARRCLQTDIPWRSRVSKSKRAVFTFFLPYPRVTGSSSPSISVPPIYLFVPLDSVPLRRKNCWRRFVRQLATALRKLRGADWPHFRSWQFSLSLEDILPTLEA